MRVFSIALIALVSLERFPPDVNLFVQGIP